MQRWLEQALARQAAWFATLGEIAAHAQAEHVAGADLRIEPFRCYQGQQG